METITLTIAAQQRLVCSTAGTPGMPPVIMVHGWLSHRGIWRKTMESLQDRYYCVAPDQLGFGASDKPDKGDYRIEAHAQRILQVADVLGLARFALMGHSMGGQIALYVAARLAPERVTRVIDVAGVASGRLQPAIRRQTMPMVSFSRRIPPHWYRAMGGLAHQKWYARIVFGAWFYRMDAVPFEDWAADRTNLTVPDSMEAGHQSGQSMLACDLTPDLPNITAPTLVMFGRQDGVVPISEGHLVHQHVPGSALHEIDECGHFPMYEKPAQYFPVVRDFLAG